MNRAERRAQGKTGHTSENDQLKEAFMQILEPIAVGLITGTKKLVIDTSSLSEGQTRYTVKIADTDG